jgi:hypothetical protein
MEKSTFKFVFPKKNLEYEALANPMHIEAIAALAMAEQDADVCMVYFTEILQFVCIHVDDYDKPFRYYYEDKRSVNDVIIMIAGDDTISDFNGNEIEDFMKEHQSSDYHLVYESFCTSEEARAFMKGIEVFCDGVHQDYTAIEEQAYYTLNNRED